MGSSTHWVYKLPSFFVVVFKKAYLLKQICNILVTYYKVFSL